MKRNPDTPFTRAELYALGKYIASRPDLDDAMPKQIEVALKKAGKLPLREDHFYTAFHAGLMAMSIRKERGKDLKT